MTELFELMGKISIVGADEAEMTVNRVIDNVRASGEKINEMLSALGKDVSFENSILGNTNIKIPEVNMPESMTFPASDIGREIDLPKSAADFQPDINTDIPLENVVSAIKDKINGVGRSISDIQLPPVFISDKASSVTKSESENGAPDSESIFRRLAEAIRGISSEKSDTSSGSSGQSIQELNIKSETLKDPFSILSEGIPDSAAKTEELISEMLTKIANSSREQINSEGLNKLLSDDAEKAAVSISKGMDKTGSVLEKALDRIGKNSKTHWNSIASAAGGVGEKMAESVSSGVSNVESACRNVANIAAAALNISGEGAGAYLIDTMNRGITAKAWELYETASRVASNISSIMSSVTMSVSAISGSSKLAGHAKGGIVTREHIARVGEQGAEAIIPLENNTEWIDRVAERLNVSGSDERVLSKLDELNKSISGMKIYLDGNVLVGSIAPQIDRKLGSIARQKRRGYV